MEIPQLKLLAARLRELLKQSACLVGHSQSLDLIAALPGLRNWPEVNAFPDRVVACQLDLASTGRLAFRLQKKFQFEHSAQQLLDALQSFVGKPASDALAVWPGGPPAGVYLTTSRDAINALLELYEEATDGGLVYAEAAGSHHPGSVNLGEDGLWSKGLDRVPSGTLLVLGPVELDQQSWEDAGQRLETACCRAWMEGHRVAVLVETPTPDTLLADARLLVCAHDAEPDGELPCDAWIVGIVAGDGQLRAQPSQRFAGGRARPVQSSATLNALPPATIEPLRQALARRSTGLLLVCSSEIQDHYAIDQVTSALALTEAAGPAARIQSRHRSTPAKDWLVPEPIKELPFLPSIQSAYAQGYRRMIIEAQYLKADLVIGHPEVLFIAGTYGHDAVESAMKYGLQGRKTTKQQALASLIASVGVLYLETDAGMRMIPDLIVAPHLAEVEENEDAFEASMQFRWEDAVGALLDSGACTIEQLSELRNRRLKDFLADRQEKRETA